MTKEMAIKLLSMDNVYLTKEGRELLEGLVTEVVTVKNV